MGHIYKQWNLTKWSPINKIHSVNSISSSQVRLSNVSRILQSPISYTEIVCNIVIVVTNITLICSWLPVKQNHMALFGNMVTSVYKW